MDLTKFEQGGPDREVDLDQIWAKWTWSRGGSGPQGEGGTGPGRLELGLGGRNWAWEAGTGPKCATVSKSRPGPEVDLQLFQSGAR